MPDIAALVTPPLLLDSTGKPANGEIFLTLSQDISVSGGIATPVTVKGLVTYGQFTALDGQALNVPVTPEGAGVHIFVELREDRPSGSGQVRAKYGIRRTVSVPDQASVTWAELVDVVPVESGGDYIVPPWVAGALAASEAAEVAAGLAEVAAAGAEIAKVDAETAATDAVAAAVTAEALSGNTRVFVWDGAAYQPAAKLGLPGPREFRGPVDPAGVVGVTLAAYDTWVKITPSPPILPAAGLVADYVASDLALATGAAVTTLPNRVSGGTALTAFGSPTFRISGGRTFIAFDGVDDYMQNTTLLVSQPSTTIVIGRYLSAVNGAVLATSTDATGRNTLGINAAPAFNVYSGASLGITGAVNTAWHYFRAEYSGATGKNEVDGAVVTGNVGSETRKGLRIGASDSLGAFYGLEIARVAVYNRVLSTAEVASIRADMKAWYVLP